LIDVSKIKLTSKSTRTRNSWLRFASLHNFSQPLLSLLFGRYMSVGN
jgi:hypothetical protein